MSLRCAIIDDEFLARQYLTDYVKKVPFLKLVGDFNSPLKIMDLLQKDEVDLIFLDIQMPDITGLDFLRSLDKKPIVILTTAYKEYALEGYELDAIDYLLKPFGFNRFLKAVTKANTAFQKKEKEITTQTESKEQTDFHEEYIIIRADRKYYKINYDDLIFIEGQKAYVTFHSTEKKITALASLKDLEEKLSNKQFIRIHKSYIVSIRRINSLEGNQIEIGGQKLPVGKNYRKQVADLFGLKE